MDSKVLQLYDNILVNLVALRVDMGYLTPVDIEKILNRAVRELSSVRIANLQTIPSELRGDCQKPVFDRQ